MRYFFLMCFLMLNDGAFAQGVKKSAGSPSVIVYKDGTTEPLVSFSISGTTQLRYTANANLVRSGTYTPTAVEIFNLDANPIVTANSMQWIQVGRIVYCSGYLTVDPTTISTATAFTLTLPVLPTNNFSNTTDATGTGTFSTSGLGAPTTAILSTASGAAKTIDVGFFATDVTANRNLVYSFQYLLN